MIKKLLFVSAIFFFCLNYSLASTDMYFTKSITDCASTNKISLQELNSVAYNSKIDVCYLTHYSYNDLRILRNTIHARHGRKFKDSNLIDYFTKRTWYKINPKFNYNLLTDIQANNVKTIKLVEDLIKRKKKKIEQDTYVSENFTYNFMSLSQFLTPINKLKNTHELVSINNNILKFANSERKIDLSIKTNHEPKFGGVISGNRSWNILGNKILVYFPHSYAGIEGEGCSTQVFSLDGKKINELSFCPNYYFKHNKNLLINAVDTGAAGATAFDIDIFNINNNTLHRFKCPDSSCQGVLMTYNSSSKAIVLSILTGSHRAGSYNWNKNKLVFFDNDGAILTTGYTIDIDTTTSRSNYFYDLNNMVAITYFRTERQWLVKYSNEDVTKYLLINSEKQTEPNKTGFIIMTQSYNKHLKAAVYINGEKKGVTPYKEYLYPGEYTVKLSKEGYLNASRKFKVVEDEIYEMWPGMQSVKNKSK